MISLSRREITNAYQRGYSDGRSNKWPHHLPPEPPNEIVAALMAAMVDMRNEADGFVACAGEEDELGQRMGKIIDTCDAAMRVVDAWLKRAP